MSCYYGVYKGVNTGVFTKWEDVQNVVSGYKNAQFKKFKTRAQALHFSKTGKVRVVKDDCVHNSQGHGVNNPDHNLLTTIHIFTDGSCIKKDGVAVHCGYGVYFGDNHPRNVSQPFTEVPRTNQRSELKSILVALQIMCETLPVVVSFTIFTDSDYSMKAVTVWHKSWAKNGWKTKNGKPVSNLDLIRPIIDLLTKLGDKCTIRHIKEFGIKSHDPEPIDRRSVQHFIWYGNNQADVLAKRGAQMDTVQMDPAPGVKTIVKVNMIENYFT